MKKYKNNDNISTTTKRLWGLKTILISSIFFLSIPFYLDCMENQHAHASYPQEQEPELSKLQQALLDVKKQQHQINEHLQTFSLLSKTITNQEQTIEHYATQTQNLQKDIQTKITNCNSQQQAKITDQLSLIVEKDKTITSQDTKLKKQLSLIVEKDKTITSQDTKFKRQLGLTSYLNEETTRQYKIIERKNRLLQLQKLKLKNLRKVVFGLCACLVVLMLFSYFLLS